MAERESSKSRPVKRSGRSRRRFYRWAIVVVLGLLLGLGVVWFFRTVYNPFARGVPSPLVLVPEDCDFVVSIPDFPALANGIQDRSFVEAVSKHPGFAEFLQTPFVRDVGVVEVVREAILRLNLARGTLPFGLDLVGDVSGTHVVIAGYVPKAAASGPEKLPYRFMAVIRPNSWLSVAGVNVLLDKTLYGWFLRGEIEKDGTEVEHFRDSVRIRPRRLGRDFFVTRIADTILVSTEGQQLSRIHNAVTLSGLPIAPHARYQRLIPEFQTRLADAIVLARRGAVDQELRVDRTLRELWGADTLDLAESSFPRLGGEDVLAYLNVDDALSLTLAGDRGKDRARDFGPLLQPFGAERLRASLGEVARLFPKEGFGVVYFEAALGQIVRVALERGLLAKTFVEELDGWLSRTAAFRSRQGFYGFFDTVAKDRIALVCFRQPRETYVDKAEPGLAIVAPLDNESALRAALAEVEGQVRRMEAKVVTDLVKRKAGTVEIFEPMLAGSAVDDYRVTKPAIAIVEGMVILTNFAPVLDLIPEALARRDASLAAHAGLEAAVATAPQDLRVALLGDLSAIYPYLEQSIQGWTTSRTRVTTLDYVRWNAEFAETSRAKQFKPGTPDWESAQIEFVSRKKEAHESIVRPRVLRDYESHLRYFKDLFSSLSIFVEESAGSLAFSLRLTSR